MVADCLVRKPAAGLYAFCRRPENLPRLTDHPVEIAAVPGHAARWTVRVPFGDRQIEWDTALINDEPGTLIAWQSLPGAPVPNAWTVRFEPTFSGASTKVTVQLEFDPPGKLATMFNGLLAKKTQQQLTEALGRFRALMEAT